MYSNILVCNCYSIVGEMVDVLNDANAIPKVIQMMKEHINIPCEQ